VQGFLKSLAEQVLPGIRIGDVSINRQHQVVGDQRVRLVEKKPRLRMMTARSSVVNPSADFHRAMSAGHVDFLRHPVIGRRHPDISAMPSDI